MKNSIKYLMTLVLLAAAFVGCKKETPYVCEGAGGDIYVKFGGTGITDTRLLVTTDGYIGETYAVSYKSWRLLLCTGNATTFL